jgi:curved DNA-binding protein CbpA
MLTNKLMRYNFYKITKRFLKDYDPEIDYYKILGLTKQSTEKEIKVAYYKLAKQYHPDVNQGKTNEKFKEMSAAYDILSDSVKRREYDASRSFSSFYSGKQYSSSSYNNTNSYNNYQYSNYRTNDDPFKNMNDFFRNFYKKNQQQNYKSNFYENPKDFKSKYYHKNKDYFKTFNNINRNEEDSKYYEESPKKSSTNFSRKYFEKNKKYYESFKKPNTGTENESRYNSSYSTEDTKYSSAPQSEALFIILTLLGIFIGSNLIHSIFNSGKGRSTPTQSYQQPKHVIQPSYQEFQSGESIYQDPYSNKKL